ncbi:MAG: exosortase/archaeosortase family protein [Methanophagales archaeon]|nr:exosortase/archaeosortase family protein [Methanophagales archaeon]
MAQKTKTHPVLLILISTLILILYYRTFIWLISEWLTNPYYSHGFLIPFISTFIAWLRRKETAEEGGTFKGAGLILGFGLLLLISGFLYGVDVIAALSFIPVTIGLLLHLYPNKMHAVLFPILFLIFAIPLPIEGLGYSLQIISAKTTASIVSLLGLHVSRQGAQLSLKSSSFFIGEPCSGMQMLIALLALAALLAYFMNCSTIKRLAIFVSGMPIAMLSNTLRISSIILVASFSGTGSALDLFHPASSILLFLFASAILLAIAKLLRCEVMPR